MAPNGREKNVTLTDGLTTQKTSSKRGYLIRILQTDGFILIISSSPMHDCLLVYACKRHRQPSPGHAFLGAFVLVVGVLVAVDLVGGAPPVGGVRLLVALFEATCFLALFW